MDAIQTTNTIIIIPSQSVLTRLPSPRLRLGSGARSASPCGLAPLTNPDSSSRPILNYIIGIWPASQVSRLGPGFTVLALGPGLNNK